MGMLSRKEFLLLALMSSATTAAFAGGCAGNRGQSAGFKSTEYEGKLFDTSYVHTVDITLEKDDWASILAHPLDKEKFPAQVTIDGETFDNVKVSTRGSYSLRGMVEANKARYSLRIKFDDDADQGYHGLDTVILGNCSPDPTFLKNYLAYGLFGKIGVPSALVSHAWITVNGEPYGFFTAIESFGEAFLARCLSDSGKLYKPEAADLAAIGDNQTKLLKERLETGKPLPESYRADLSTLRVYNDGADLRYTDDDPASYSDIFDNAESDIDDADKARVINALKELSLGNIEQAVDADEVVKYFAVHNFTCNYDSYTGKLNHNYCLYENEGRLSMLPWDYDYNDAMVASEDGSANTKYVGDHEDALIDEPLLVPEDSRPMWSWIPNSDKYRDAYHSELDKLLTEHVESGWVNEEIDRVADMIREYVGADPNAVFTPEQFEKAIENLHQFFDLRAENVRRQLKGA